MKEMENTQVVRHLNLEKMTRSIEKEEFQDEYKPYYGLYDNDGLESFVKIDDIYNVACLDTLTASIQALKLRARFNSQRSAEVYLCWLMTDDRAKKRDEKYSQEFSSYINKIVAEIPADERGSHRVYFKHKRSHNEDDFHYYSLKYEHMFKSYSYSTDLFKIETRDDKLVSIIQGKPFEMGQKLYDLEQLCSRKSHYVKHIMWELVQDQLREKFKNTRPSKAFIIELGSSKYTVICDDIYSYYYKFDLVESIIDPVVIDTQI